MSVEVSNIARCSSKVLPGRLDIKRHSPSILYIDEWLKGLMAQTYMYMNIFMLYKRHVSCYLNRCAFHFLQFDINKTNKVYFLITKGRVSGTFK